MSDVTRFEKDHDLASKGSQLCLSCGLCCQGLLRDHAPLETGETELATQLGLPAYLEDSDSHAFLCLVRFIRIIGVPSTLNALELVANTNVIFSRNSSKV